MSFASNVTTYTSLASILSNGATFSFFVETTSIFSTILTSRIHMSLVWS